MALQPLSRLSVVSVQDLVYCLPTDKVLQPRRSMSRRSPSILARLTTSTISFSTKTCMSAPLSKQPNTTPFLLQPTPTSVAASAMLMKSLAKQRRWLALLLKRLFARKLTMSALWLDSKVLLLAPTVTSKATSPLKSITKAKCASAGNSASAARCAQDSPTLFAPVPTKLRRTAAEQYFAPITKITHLRYGRRLILCHRHCSNKIEEDSHIYILVRRIAKRY